MRQAINEAKKAFAKGDVPIGAVLVHEGKIIARAHNAKECKQSPTAHAELLALEKGAKKLGSWRLLNTTLYTTVEPCPMCAGALLQARVSKVVYGVPDIRWGAVETFYSMLDDKRFNHQIESASGLCKVEIEALLKKFFSDVRKGNITKPR